MRHRALAMTVAVGLLLSAASARAYTPLSHIDLDEWGRIDEIEVVGGRAVLLDSGTIFDDYVEEPKLPYVRVVDVSKPRKPRLVGQRKLKAMERPQGLAVEGHHAFVATNWGLDEGGRMHIFDISPDGAPGRIATLPFPQTAREVVVRDGLAYVTISSGTGDGSSLRVVDVSTPDAPSEVGAVDLPGVAHGFALEADLVFVSVGPESLWIVDVSQPDDPQVVGSAGDGSAGTGDEYDDPHARDVEIRGDAVYVANGVLGPRVFDVANLTDPVELGLLDAERSTTAIEVANGLVYMTRARDGLRVSDPDGLDERMVSGEHDLPDFPGSTRDFEIVGDRAYFAMGSGGMWSYDVTRLPTPPVVGSLLRTGWFAGVEWVGDLAYVFDVGDDDAPPALRIIDLSNPAEPVERGALEVLERADGMEVGDGFVYLIEGPGVGVVDVSDPDAPRRRGSLDFKRAPKRLMVDGDRLYVAVQSKIVIVDVSDPDAPAKMGKLKFEGRPAPMVLAGDLLYTALLPERFAGSSPMGLRIVDISDPEDPEVVGELDTPELPGDLLVRDGLVYLTSCDEGLQVFDASRPESPRLLGTTPLLGDLFSCDTDSISVAGGVAYVAGSSTGFGSVAIWNPERPVVTSMTLPSMSAPNRSPVTGDFDLAGDLAVIVGFLGHAGSPRLPQAFLEVRDVAAAEVPGPPVGEDGCPAAPSEACLEPGAPGAAKLRLKRSDRSLRWIWKDAPAGGPFPDPADGGDAHFCFYREGGLDRDTSATLPTGARWRVRDDGFKYKARGGDPHGVERVEFAAAADRDTIEVRGGHSFSLPLEEQELTVQLHAASGACWGASFPAPAKKNDAKRFVGRSP